jgi:hypothetical protein
MMLRRLAIILALGLLPAACVIQTRYPGAWPGIDPTRVAGCPDVSGIYLNDGVKGDPFAAATSLSGLLLAGPAPGATARISQYAGDSLAVSVAREGRELARKVFSRARGTLACDPAGVRLACGRRRAVYLAKAVDGSLMAQEVEFAIVATTRSWHRFSPPTLPPLPEGTDVEP